ncbi:MAG TPA: FtsX-like permease family protein [Candidatus Pelethocola excrementipullorum]|nr:FtsX-like permease family protein [Candidatus Pelethocola excrementipullorum]
MSKGFYSKLALQNIKKNGKIYVPYLLMSIFITAMYYIIYSLSVNKGLDHTTGGSSIKQILGMGTWIVGFFALIFLFYINSFLMKRRKKEFGLYSMLGMEKRHLGRVVFWENTIIAVFSIITGILLGLLLNKLVYMGLVNMFQSEIPLGFEISFSSIIASVKLMGTIHLLIFLNGLRQVWLANPIELLHGENVGEREPKTKVLMAVMGFLCLGAGYYLAVTTTNPVAAIFVLLLAIILVMIGTYFTFTAGSIAILKLLRKNKNYYYKTKHFVSVSGMIYRMKQNAVGLANIAILCTGVLLMISTTLSLYADLNGIIDKRYPRDITVSGFSLNEDVTDLVLENVKEASEELHLETNHLFYYSYIAMPAIISGDELITNQENIYGLSGSDICDLYILSLDEYNRLNGDKKELEDGEILFYGSEDDIEKQNLQLLGKSFSIKENLKDFAEGSGLMSSNVVQSFVLIVKDTETIEEIKQLQQSVFESEGGSYVNAGAFFGFDVKGDSSQKMAFKQHIITGLEPSPESFRVDDRDTGSKDFLGTYSGLFFIGIFLSLLFVVATVLIIYYKQISEGYDDCGRFEIMQKVGMDKREIRRSINSQVLNVFFLPLVTAGIHTLFAFPIMKRLMLMLGLNNTTLYLVVTGICFLIFAVFYAVVYKLTARVYYKIVS